MKLLVWLLRIVVFIALLGLAIKNETIVELRFFFERSLQAPLSLVVLAAFAAGTLVGLSAAVATMVRQRIEIGRLRKAAEPPRN